MATVLLLGPARQAAGGVSSTMVDAVTVAAVCDELVARHGPGFAEVLATARIWVDGEPAEPPDPVPAHAEVSVLPPVSGG